nr:MAG TPA: hypothetical protein [Caudoviricetes sp.]
MWRCCFCCLRFQGFSPFTSYHFAFGFSPLSLTRLYHGITVLSSPIFEPLKR